MHFQALTPQELFEQDRKTLAPRLPRAAAAPLHRSTIRHTIRHTIILGGTVVTYSPPGVPDRMGL